MKILSRGKWLALALALLILGVASPLSAAGSASLRIPGAAFQSPGNDIDFIRQYGGLYVLSYPYVPWVAPVYLPQGAVVTSVRMFYYDIDYELSCSAVFRAQDFATGEDVDLTPLFFSSGSSGLGYVDSPPINHTIDYNKYAYLLIWNPTAVSYHMILKGFQIFYTPPPSTPPPGKVVVIPLF